MEFNLTDHLPENFSPTSRVWIYQSSRMFLMTEAFEMEDILKDFAAQWNSHGTPVKGYANLFFGRFIVFMADETATGVSGCSTDSSVRVVKEIEKKYQVELFNRQLLAFIVKDKVEQIPLAQLSYALENNLITPETLYFNNTVLTKKQLLEEWIIPVKNSWLKKMLPQSSALA